MDSERRLKTIFEHAPDAYYITDRTGKFLDGNKAAEELVGYSKQEFIGRDFLNSGILSPDQMKVARNLLERCAAKQKTSPVEFNLMHKTGRAIDLEVRAVPYILAGHEVILCIARDISERRKTERQLSRLASIIEQFDNSVVLTELDGTINYANPACAKAMNKSLLTWS